MTAHLLGTPRATDRQHQAKEDEEQTGECTRKTFAPSNFGKAKSLVVKQQLCQNARWLEGCTITNSGILVRIQIRKQYEKVQFLSGILEIISLTRVSLSVQI